MTEQIQATPQVNTQGAGRKWTAPHVAIIDLRSAEGSISGPLCDKHGSLSTGGGCTR